MSLMSLTTPANHGEAKKSVSVLWNQAAVKCFPAATCLLIRSQGHFNKHSTEIKDKHIFAYVYSTGSIGEMFSLFRPKRLS